MPERTASDGSMGVSSMAGHEQTPDRELCELLKLKIAKAIPRSLMADFQQWLTLEQSLAYSKGREDEARFRDHPEDFTFEQSR